MEFRLTVTVSRHGHDPVNGQRFLKGFIDTHPEVGAVVDQDLEAGHLSVTYSLEAEDFGEAARIGGDIFEDGANASGLEATDFLGAHIEPVVEADFVS